MNRLFALLLIVLFSAVPAGAAARLVSGVSNDTIQITSSFDGERLTFFGTIAPEAGRSSAMSRDPSTS